MINIKVKNIFVFLGTLEIVFLTYLVIFLCSIKFPAVYADEEKQDVIQMEEYSNNFDGLDTNEGVIKDPEQSVDELITPSDVSKQSSERHEDTEIDDARLEFLSQTLEAEKQRLAELELDHKKLLDEIVAQQQQDYNDKEDTLSEKNLLTTVRQDKAASSHEIDFQDLKPAGNVDLLGTADGLYKLLRYEAALQIYRSIDPEKTSEEDNSWISYQIANCCRNLKQFDNALSTFQELQAKYPDTYPAKEAKWYLEHLNWWKQWYEKANAMCKVKETVKPQPPSVR